MVKKNILGRKLGRDMWKSRMQFVAVILLCALGSWCFSGLDALWRTIDLTANTYFDEGNVADLWVNMNMDREALETLRNFPDVEDVQARFSTQVKADLPHEPVLQLEAYDGVMRINVPRMVSGEALEPSDLRGCLLDDGFARANGLGLGDKLTLKTAAGDYDFWIRGTCQSADCTIVLDARLPRTLAGILAGGALGLAGALMQTLTRNPLADPGLLGVNAGASFAIVLGAALFGYSSAQEQLAMAFAGALVASLIVAFTGSQGGGQLSPVRLTLAGVALAAVLEGLTSGIALLNPDVYDQLRFWQAGSLDIRNLHTLKVVLIPVLIAGVTALLLSRALNSLSLGSDTATALGSRVARTQLIGLLAITVLCGSATAVVGPIAFIGLMMPHMARWLVGADHRWSLPVTLLATPALLLFADIIGRVIVPGELRVSVVSAFIGAPVLIFLVRRKTRGGA